MGAAGDRLHALAAVFFVSHVFRMSLFFLLAGFFGRMMLERRGTRAFVRDRAKRILLPLAVYHFNLEGWPSWTGLLAPFFLLPERVLGSV